MARRKSPRVRRRLVDPQERMPPPEGIPAWVGQVFGVALILGDFFLGSRIVESFEAFGDGGLSGFGDPFAAILLVGIVGWWIVVLGWRWTAPTVAPVPMSAGAGLTALVVAFVTSVLIVLGLGEAVPVLAWRSGDGTHAVAVGLITVLFLGLTFLQWWRLQAGDPGPPNDSSDPREGDFGDSPEEGSQEGASSSQGGRGPPSDRRPGPVSPLARLVASLLLLPAGWALMAPGDLLARRAQEGIERGWEGGVERIGVAAMASVASAGVGMLLAHGPRVLASRILGEGQGTWRFFSGLWMAHFLRLVLGIRGW